MTSFHRASTVRLRRFYRRGHRRRSTFRAMGGESDYFIIDLAVSGILEIPALAAVLSDEQRSVIPRDPSILSIQEMHAVEDGVREFPQGQLGFLDANAGVRGDYVAWGGGLGWVGGPVGSFVALLRLLPVGLCACALSGESPGELTPAGFILSGDTPEFGVITLFGGVAWSFGSSGIWDGLSCSAGGPALTSIQAERRSPAVPASGGAIRAWAPS